MEDLYYAILNRLAEIPDLKKVDIDWGQLDELQDSYPILYPCALVDVYQTQWEDSGSPLQLGSAFIRIKIGVEIISDTDPDSGSLDDSIKKIGIVADIHKKLQRWTPMERCSKLTRNITRVYNLIGVKVFEVEYLVTFSELAV